MRKASFLVVLMTAFGLMAGCADGGSIPASQVPGADGGGGGGGGGGGNGGGGNGDGGGVAENCDVPLGSICLLAGDGSNDTAILDGPGGLLSPDGALGPIADAIPSDDLQNALVTLLENDGDLAALVEELLVNGQLQEGLEELLLGGEDGMGGLQDILTDLLMGTEEGEGLQAVVGEEGLAGLVQALLIEPTDPDCQASLGTVCLIAGEESGQDGLVDLLLTQDGALAQLSDNLSQDQLVAELANLLESDGSLADLVTGLFMEGQLQEGLETLLIGDPEAGVDSGLVQTLEGLLDPSLVEELVTSIGTLLGAGGA